MKSILETCIPRPDILQGSFNPEIFTASLGAVIDSYRGGGQTISSLYTEAGTFFRDATFPTIGLKETLAGVFGRLAGDNTLPAIRRLETAFGGGKTHTLIACTHIAARGKELAAVTAEVIDPKLLPDPGEITIVGIAGDLLPVNKQQSDELTPYTLWGELAFQVGGEELYRKVEADATSMAAPGEAFFRTVFKGRKVLVMLDELAQYAARLEAAHAGGAEQLAAFLMTLHGYARNNAGVAILLTLAGSQNAFASQTGLLRKLITQVTGSEVSDDEAIAIAERGDTGIRSVVLRDASTVIPVQAAEISRILAKRLFVKIDSSAGAETAAEYASLYQKAQGTLPDQATRADFADLMAANYPFHPTFIDFLTKKLSSVESFQGTRGVLRVLSLAVRNIWQKKQATPMIHTCHLDLRDYHTVSEIVSRTESNDLLNVLNADVGGVDTPGIEGGKSNAQLADEANPHPEGYPMHELTWKTIFLHSLVGRGEGLGSNLFGLSEQDALFATAFPGLSPAQVHVALQEIGKRAYYLRSRDGRYFASLDPSVNIALARIRRSLLTEEVNDLLITTARKVVRPDSPPFKVLHDVRKPQHIPDKQDKLQLAMIALDEDEIDVDSFIQTRGPEGPREQQNTIFLLVPETVHVKGTETGEFDALSPARQRADRSRTRLQDLAKDVLAMQKLKDKPQNYAIDKKKLEEHDFDVRQKERDQALVTGVAEVYDSLWFPSASGTITRKEIKTAGAEGGTAVIEKIKEALIDERELITGDQATAATSLALGKIFFAKGDQISLVQLRKNFLCLRSWPVVDSRQTLDRLITSGVAHNHWCLYRMSGDATETKPAEIYAKDTHEVPIGLDLNKPEWAIMTLPGAKKRHWLASDKAEPAQVAKAVEQAVLTGGATTVKEIIAKVQEEHGNATAGDVTTAIQDLALKRKLVSYSGKKSQEEKPEKLRTGPDATLWMPDENDVITTPAVATEKGWIGVEDKTLRVDGDIATQKLLPMLKKLGGLYSKGAKSKIDTLQISNLGIKGGGTMEVILSDVPPDAMKQLAEFFEILAERSTTGEAAGYLEVSDPVEGCALVKELQ